MDDEDIQFIEPPSKDYFCPVCLEILEDPFQMQCCGSHVCQNCSNHLKVANADCFFCRKEGINATEDKYFKRQVLDLRVRCYYSKAGCEWEGELRDLPNHVALLSPEPEYAICACGCDQKMQVDNSVGKVRCAKIPIACIYCTEKCTFDTLVSEHFPYCEKYPVECPNHCQYNLKKFMRQHLQDHLEQVCSKRVIFSPNPLKVTFAENKCFVAPFTFTMTHFFQHKRSKGFWCTPPFLTSKNGYTIQLRIYPNGFNTSIDSDHISIFAFVMTGKYDSDLQWPLFGEMTVEVINWRSDKNHYIKKIYFLGDDLCQRVKDTPLAPWGKGHNDFLPYNLLFSESDDTKYLCYDSLCLRVGNFKLYCNSVCAFPGSPQPPLVAFMVNSFTKQKETLSRFYSPPFYSSSQGYKFIIGVDAASTNEKSHIGLHAQLMKGKNDELLDWPCCVDIFITLVNWRENKNHYTKNLCISNQCEEANCQIASEELSTRDCGGFKKFIAHSALLYNASSGTQYLQNDCLYFRVDEITTYSVPPLSKVPRWLDPRKSLANVTLYQFSKRKKFNNIYHSLPFLSHSQGYNIQLVIYANGNNDDRDSYVSIYVTLTRGKFDDTLQWPFRADIEVEVLNWKEDRLHEKYICHFNEERNYSACCRSTEKVAPTPLGTTKMVAHSALSYNASTNTLFLENNCLCFRVKNIAIYSAHSFSKIPIWQNLQFVDPAPQFSLFQFSQRMLLDNEILGPSFYTHRNGYKMRLSIHANGILEGKNSHVSVLAVLMKGEYDDILRWPFQGDIVVEVLNWKKNQNHYKFIISFHGATPDISCSRVTTGEHGYKWGCHRALPHSTLYKSSANTSYLLDDCILFKVTEVVVYSDALTEKVPQWQYPNKCFGFTINHLHKRIGLENTYYSAPFYTHAHGYKMRIEVVTAGDGSGAGTHVSVYARLLKGEHDSELEWPLRADLVVELLNWSGDRDHVQFTFRFDYNCGSQCIDQVVGDAVVAQSCLGFCKLMLHHTLFTKPSERICYLNDGRLRFRIRNIGVYSTNSMLENKIPHWQSAKQAAKSFCQFSIPYFSTRQKLNNVYHSRPFYTDYKRGYKMRLEVHVKDQGHVSIYARLLKGQYDDDLSWPVRVELSVYVLNWLADIRHQQHKICFRTASTNSCNRLLSSEAAEDTCGISFVIPAAFKRVNFIEDDCMCIRINAVNNPHWWS